MPPVYKAPGVSTGELHTICEYRDAARIQDAGAFQLNRHCTGSVTRYHQLATTVRRDDPRGHVNSLYVLCDLRNLR